MNRHYLDPLSHLLAKRARRRQVITGLGATAAGAAVAGGVTPAGAQDEEACHANCNATVPPGPALGLCHAQCGLQAAQAAQARVQTTISAEAQCHLSCNTSGAQGVALAMCHLKCAAGL